MSKRGASIILLISACISLSSCISGRKFSETAEKARNITVSITLELVRTLGKIDVIQKKLPQESRYTSIELVHIPGGTFVMANSSKKSRFQDVAHPVVLDSFYISATEVTQGQYDEVMGVVPEKLKKKGKNFPVSMVSWYDAVIFCNQLSLASKLTPYYSIDKNVKDENNLNSDTIDPLRWTVRVDAAADGFRLPTEAQWEYAARGGSAADYYWGDFPAKYDEYEWIGGEDSSVSAHPVGLKNPNPYGLYDMGGNVSEFCYDYYVRDFDKTLQKNPMGPEQGRGKVYRGGNYFCNYTWYAEVWARSWIWPHEKSNNVGFRVVLPVRE